MCVCLCLMVMKIYFILYVRLSRSRGEDFLIDVYNNFVELLNVGEVIDLIFVCL